MMNATWNAARFGVLIVCLVASMTLAQDRSGKSAIGIRAGATSYQGDDYGTPRLNALGTMFVEQYASNRLSFEFGANLGQLAGKSGVSDFRSQIAGGSLIARFGLTGSAGFRPYLAAGAEFLFPTIRRNPAIANLDDFNGDNHNPEWGFPFGGGASFALGDNTRLDFRGLFHFMLPDNLDGNGFASGDDHFATATAGLTYFIGGPRQEVEKSPTLTSNERKRLTAPAVTEKKPEPATPAAKPAPAKPTTGKMAAKAPAKPPAPPVKKPEPAVAPDMDGDGLLNTEEEMTYKTDPRKADTDGDGLNDGEEVKKFKTDPLNADTDGDGLSDGSEVMTHKTMPLEKDTDKGTIDDGAEVKRGSNPLDASDDVPVLDVKKGEAIVLEGVRFDVNSARIRPESRAILDQAYFTLKQHGDIRVAIHGHTDSTGPLALNRTLSLARANAVSAWLVNRGIDASRLTTQGFGPDKPIASNATAEGRQQNRRIEFVVQD